MSETDIELLREAAGCLALVLAGLCGAQIYLRLCKRYGRQVSVYLHESAKELRSIVRELWARVKRKIRARIPVRGAVGQRVMRPRRFDVEIFPQPTLKGRGSEKIVCQIHYSNGRTVGRKR